MSKPESGAKRMSKAQRIRPLDDKRLGLLLRMTGIPIVVCRKRTVEPLLRRKFLRINSVGNYQITPLGRKFALDWVDKNTGRKIETWPAISIGSCVMILQDGERHD